MCVLLCVIRSLWIRTRVRLCHCFCLCLCVNMCTCVLACVNVCVFGCSFLVVLLFMFVCTCLYDLLREFVYVNLCLCMSRINTETHTQCLTDWTLTQKMTKKRTTTYILWHTYTQWPIHTLARTQNYTHVLTHNPSIFSHCSTTELNTVSY